jgi:protein gp37
MSKSSIEWTEVTWNPVAGCSVISPGCTNCYAMRMAARLTLMGQGKYDGATRMSGGRPKWNGTINLEYSTLELPLKWRKGRMIFVNSMSDIFHDDVPVSFIERIFDTMQRTCQHTYQILTKRAENLERQAPKLHWPSNLWMGVSVEQRLTSGV